MMLSYNHCPAGFCRRGFLIGPVDSVRIPQHLKDETPGAF